MNLAALIFFLLPQAWAGFQSPCDWNSHGLWAKNLKENPIKTLWAKTMVDRFQDSPLLYLRSFKPTVREYSIQEGSSFSKNPEVLDLIEDFESWNLSPVSEALSQNGLKWDQTLERQDWHHWLQFKKELYQSFKNKLLVSVPEDRTVPVLTLLQSFEEKVTFLNSWVVDGRMLPRMAKGHLEYVTGLKGTLGEIKALLALKQVFAIDQRLNQIEFFKKANDEAFRRIFLRYANDPKGLFQLVEQYPDFFHNPTFTLDEMFIQLKNPDFVDSFVERVGLRIQSRGIHLKGIRTEKYGFFETQESFLAFVSRSLKKDPETYSEFLYDSSLSRLFYPTQFSVNEIPFRFKTPERILKYLVEMRDLYIGTREFDGYVEVDGKHIVLEIKNSSVLRMNPATLTSDQERVLAKARRQVTTNLQLFEFLGVHSQVEYQYISLEGLYPALRKELVEQGIKVH